MSYAKYLVRVQFLDGDSILTERQATESFGYSEALAWWQQEADIWPRSEKVNYVMLVGERDGLGYPLRSVKYLED